jgi:glutathione S-transferase
MDKLHYIRIPKAQGGRAEMVRLTYVLAGKPWTDVLHTFSEVAEAVRGKNPFRQLPFVETPEGEHIVQALAIMHHVGHGTPAWPSEPKALTQALGVAMGAYDLFQWFGSFAADDAPAKKRFEDRRAPQFFNALGEIYAARDFAVGGAPTFADCIAHEAVAWCARRNEVCRELLAGNAALSDFMARFRAVPDIKAFMERQASAREADDSV